jgi:hypothetical protein
LKRSAARRSLVSEPPKRVCTRNYESLPEGIIAANQLWGLSSGRVRTCNPVIKSQMAVAAIAATKERILSVKKECGAESYLLDVLSFLRAFIRPVLESARRKRANRFENRLRALLEKTWIREVNHWLYHPEKISRNEPTSTDSLKFCSPPSWWLLEVIRNCIPADSFRIVLGYCFLY